MDAWVAGDWELLPEGLKALGNAIDAAPLEIAEGADEGSRRLPFVETLNTKAARRRVITQQEAEELLAVVNSDEMWENFHQDDLIDVKRHKDRSLFGGAIFVKVSGHFPGTTVDHVANCYMNFEDRAKWDKQMDGFKVLHHGKGNDLLYSVLHSPPLSDRDFLMFHTVLRHRGPRSGLMFYSRSADDDLGPPPRSTASAVRATQYMAAHQLIQDAHGVSFMTATAVDPHIPFLPRWVLSLLLPSEFKRWRTSVLRRCKELQGQAVPCTVLWSKKDDDGVKKPEALSESWGSPTTGAPSENNVLSDIIIEETEQSTVCCCTPL